MGRIEISDLKLITSEPLVGMAPDFYESEMALISERMELCGKKVLDTAGVVREAIFHQSRNRLAAMTFVLKLSLVLVAIADIDRPYQGLVKVEPTGFCFAIRTFHSFAKQ